MAREESDREDLLREATALVRRIEFHLPDGDEPIVMGFRRDGALSVFLGADPVFQFNAAGELRRAYVDGTPYKADRGTLAQLQRERTETEVHFVRHDLNPELTRLFLLMVAARLLPVRIALAAEIVEVVGQVPPEGDLLPACLAELERVGRDVRIANSARATHSSPRRGEGGDEVAG